MEALLLRGVPLVYCWGFNLNGQCAIFGQEDAELIHSGPDGSTTTAPNGAAPTIPLAATVGPAQNNPGQANSSIPSECVTFSPKIHQETAFGRSTILATFSLMIQIFISRYHVVTGPHMVRFFLDKPSIRLITTGGNHSMALTDDESCARLWVWGANNDAQLGLGHTDPVNGPVELSFFRERGERIAALYGGYNYSLALTASGELYSWGYNNFGQLGLGHTNQHASAPNHVSFFSTHGIKIKEIATGGNHVLLLTEDHRVYCWGYNKYASVVSPDPILDGPNTKFEFKLILFRELFRHIIFFIILFFGGPPISPCLSSSTGGTQTDF
jgi:hypothetical protein